jgi:hypothetical protein
MELRDHPLMRYRGTNNWPPVWVPTKRLRATVMAGEIGILTAVRFRPNNSGECYLIIEHQNEEWIGALLFDDTRFSATISILLLENLGRPISEIGSIEISYTL